MTKYKFLAKDREGKALKETLLASSRYEAMGLLKERDLTVISLSSVDSDRSIRRKRSRSTRKKKHFFSRLKVSLGEFSIFCRQLSVCVGSGIDLIEALRSIAKDMDNPGFKAILFKVIDDIKGGKSFSEAITRYEKVFSPLFVSLMKAAEESGSIRKVLEYISAHLEKSERLKTKIRSITSYPIFVSLFFIVVVFIVTIFILPRFQSLFSSFNDQLPPLTQIVFNINNFLISNIQLFVISILAIVFGIIAYGRSPIGRYHIDGFKLRIPLFGELIRKVYIARFCCVLAIMIRGGVPIENAMEITSRTCGNKVLEKSLVEVRSQITNGSDFASGLERDENFPSLMVRMVSVGESSGKLPEVLDKVSDMYEEQVEGSVQVATSLFEPIAIVVFGGMILVLVLAIYIPVFKIAMSSARA